MPIEGAGDGRFSETVSEAKSGVRISIGDDGFGFDRHRLSGIRHTRRPIATADGQHFEIEYIDDDESPDKRPPLSATLLKNGKPLDLVGRALSRRHTNEDLNAVVRHALTDSVSIGCGAQNRLWGDRR